MQVGDQRDFTCQFARLEEPPPPEMQQLLAAIHGNDEAMSSFVSAVAGVVSLAEFSLPRTSRAS
jgi:hypothetical protein